MKIDRLAVRPPEYFPRLDYLALMQAVDVFVLADTFQYSRQSFQNRTRVRTPQGWSWVSVPLVGRQHGLPIHQTIIDNATAWPSKHRRALQYNYRQTPFYDYYEAHIASFFERNWTTLGDLLAGSVSLICEMYGLKCKLVRASELPEMPNTMTSIISALDSGITVLLPDNSYDQDVEAIPNAQRFKFKEPAYRQHFDGFEEKISSLDLFFNYGPEAGKMLHTGTQEDGSR